MSISDFLGVLGGRGASIPFSSERLHRDHRADYKKNLLTLRNGAVFFRQ
jgi:hypothetical protein